MITRRAVPVPWQAHFSRRMGVGADKIQIVVNRYVKKGCDIEPAAVDLEFAGRVDSADVAFDGEVCLREEWDGEHGEGEGGEEPEE